jgi:hypothetical protein
MLVLVVLAARETHLRVQRALEVLAAVATMEFFPAAAAVCMELRPVAAVWVLAVKALAVEDWRVVEVLRLLTVCLVALTAAVLLWVLTPNQ